MNGSTSRARPRWVAKIGLAVGSAVATYALVVIISRYYSWQVGIRDRDFSYENGINMWRPDPVVGFANKRNFSEYCFGTVHVATNEHGFRGRDSVPLAKSPGMIRFIGLGDSVMWGTCVDDSDSFLGLLRTKLNSDSREAEVINAGVVGYSTLQEYLFLENVLIEFSPDYVLINFCENDLWPTEDPFNLVRGVYLNFMHQFLRDSGSKLTRDEQNSIHELIRVFESPVPVHQAIGQTSNGCQRMALKLFLDIPIRRMAQQAKLKNAQLMYLFIPPRDEDTAYQYLVQIVKRTLDENQVAYLDLRPSLKDDSGGQGAAMFLDANRSGWSQWLQENLFPDLHRISLVRRINTIHQQQNYIDFIHPSKKGNEIIASRIYEQLATSATPVSPLVE